MNQEYYFWNETEWSTLALRKLIDEACVFRGFFDLKLIKIIYAKNRTKNRKYNGTSWPLYAHITIRVPKPDRDLGEPFNTKKFVQILLHELDHLRGLEHRDMVKWWTLETSGLEHRWVSPE